MTDKRYEVGVGGLEPDALSAALRKSVEDVAANFPERVGVCVFAFDFYAGGISYISNAERADMIKALREWLRKQAENY